MDNLRVLLLEDEELFRLGLVVRLQQELGSEMLAEAIDKDMAIGLTNQYLPDVVPLNVGLPGIGGVEACRQIKQLHSNIPFLVLTSHFKKQLIEQLIAVGASGYYLKGIEAETLILAFTVGCSRGFLVRWQQQPQQKFGQPLNLSQFKEKHKNNLLTTRETEILALIAAGKSNSEIAQQLHINIDTVRVHVHAILQKLEVRDRRAWGAANRTSAAIMAKFNRILVIMGYDRSKRI